MRVPTGTRIVLALVIGGLLLALVALAVRPPVPSARPGATRPASVPSGSVPPNPAPSTAPLLPQR